MGKGIVLDTNIVIGIYNNYNETIKKVPEIKTHELFISLLTYIEILAPTPMRHKANTRKFLSRFSLLPFTAETVKKAMDYSFNHVTKPPQFIDMVIFANSQANDIDLLTFNTKDFQSYS